MHIRYISIGMYTYAYTYIPVYVRLHEYVNYMTIHVYIHIFICEYTNTHFKRSSVTVCTHCQ